VTDTSGLDAYWTADAPISVGCTGLWPEGSLSVKGWPISALETDSSAIHRSYMRVAPITFTAITQEA
jgi:hypothetical protein